MRAPSLRSLPPVAFTAVRHAVAGVLAGWALLAVCVSENVSNLGYAVLGGGISTLASLVGAFGVAGAVLGAALSLALQWQAQAANRSAVARLQLMPARTPRRAHRPNQALR